MMLILLFWSMQNLGASEPFRGASPEPSLGRVEWRRVDLLSGLLSCTHSEERVGKSFSTNAGWLETDLAYSQKASLELPLFL